MKGWEAPFKMWDWTESFASSQLVGNSVAIPFQVLEGALAEIERWRPYILQNVTKLPTTLIKVQCLDKG